MRANSGPMVLRASSTAGHRGTSNCSMGAQIIHGRRPNRRQHVRDDMRRKGRADSKAAD